MVVPLLRQFPSDFVARVMIFAPGRVIRWRGHGVGPLPSAKAVLLSIESRILKQETRIIISYHAKFLTVHPSRPLLPPASLGKLKQCGKENERMENYFFLRVCLAPKQSVKTDVIRQIMERMGVGEIYYESDLRKSTSIHRFFFRLQSTKEKDFSNHKIHLQRVEAKKLFKPNRKKMFLNPLSLFYLAFASSAYFSAPSTR